ncbi:hypothetical protein HMPREF9069_01132 [Atopobium sp. oral taxon 810 str. F0209]|nr:hypothetical protein HMPREF9069_01132 [Atopobium sp. oral taxon 810 str. F0209]
MLCLAKKHRAEIKQSRGCYVKPTELTTETHSINLSVSIADFFPIPLLYFAYLGIIPSVGS